MTDFSDVAQCNNTDEKVSYSDTTTDNTIGELLKNLGDDVSALVSTEAALVRTEVADSIDAVKQGVSSILIGAAVVLGGILLVIQGLALSVSLLLGLPAAYGFLITGLVVMAIGGIAIAFARKKFSADPVTLPRITESLQKDQRVIQEKLP